MFKTLFNIRTTAKQAETMQAMVNNKPIINDAPQRSMKEIIEEIHETFYTEVDRLLAEAKILKPVETDYEALINKAERMRALGFTGAKDVKKANDELARLSALKKENEAKQLLKEAIEYFTFKYPNYKFITDESVKKICAKYNLVYGDVENYIGDVPEKNVQHMEAFKIDDRDRCYVSEYNSLYSFKPTINLITYQEYLKYKVVNKGVNGFIIGSGFEKQYASPLQIAAPVKDFNTTNMEVKNFKLSKIEIPDPVVFCPVLYKGVKFNLIVTAWGDEASDEIVVNQKMN
jgi:hypothetical protein